MKPEAMPNGTPTKKMATALALRCVGYKSEMMETEQGWPPASAAPMPTRVNTKAMKLLAEPANATSALQMANKAANKLRRLPRSAIQPKGMPAKANAAA